MYGDRDSRCAAATAPETPRFETFGSRPHASSLSKRQRPSYSSHVGVEHLPRPFEPSGNLLVSAQFTTIDAGHGRSERSLVLGGKTMTPIAPHISAFLRERLPVQRGASRHTCDTYSHAFKLLFEYASQRLNKQPSKLALEEIDSSLVMGFLDSLESVRRNSASTRNARLVAIKSFMAFVEHRLPAFLEQCRQIRAITPKKTIIRLVNHLTRDEIQALLNAPDPASRGGIRDRAMMHLCFAAGLRVSELVTLSLDRLCLHPDPGASRAGAAPMEADRRRPTCVVGYTCGATVGP